MSQAADPFDELAGLFLTEPDMPASRGGSAKTGPVELVVVSHLPVRAGLWIAPYADAMARHAGPTALIRLDDVAPHLQLLRGGGHELAGIGPTSTLAQAIEALRPVMALWILRAAADARPEELAAAGADRITILSSGNEAARVETYTLVKELVHAAERTGATPPRLAMAILGSDPETARSVFARLNQTTSSFLGVELSLALCLPEIDAGIVSGGHRRFTTEVKPALGYVVRWIRGAAPAPTRPRADQPPEPQAMTREHATSVPPASPAPAISVPPAIHSAAAEPVSEWPPSGTPWVPRGAIPLTPRCAVEVEPKQPCLPREPVKDGRPVPLAEYVEGLSPLPFRCPGHERVEIAVDRAGGLHLLGREDTLRQMHVVRRWAFDQRELISMACPQVTIDGRRGVRFHLFAERPLALHDLHGSDICLHILAPVNVGGQIGWYSAPLTE